MIVGSMIDVRLHTDPNLTACSRESATTDAVRGALTSLHSDVQSMVITLQDRRQPQSQNKSNPNSILLLADRHILVSLSYNTFFRRVA